MNSLASKLSTFWIFATLNYLYCDVVSLMDSSKLRGYLAGSVGGLEITQQFLLAGGALIEVPMAMVLVSAVATGRGQRVANIAAGSFMTIVQLATLFIAKPAPYYVFFSAIEIATTAAIAVIAAVGARRYAGYTPTSVALNDSHTSPPSPSFSSASAPAVTSATSGS